MKQSHKQSLITAIYDEAGLHETLVCYRELSSYIASAESIDASSLAALIETVNRQFEVALGAVEKSARRFN